MALWEDLTSWLRSARTKAATKATQVAAEQAAKQAKVKLSEAGDAFLDDAEAELQRAQKAREGRPAVSPSHEDADAIAARVLAAAEESRTAEQVLRAPRPTPTGQAPAEPAPPTAAPDDPEARAREELARMKADLHERLHGKDDPT